LPNWKITFDHAVAATPLDRYQQTGRFCPYSHLKAQSLGNGGDAMRFPTKGTAIVYEAKAAEGLEHLGLKVLINTWIKRPAGRRGRLELHTLLGYLLDGELEGTPATLGQLSCSSRGFPYHKRLEDFDYTAQRQSTAGSSRNGHRTLHLRRPQRRAPGTAGCGQTSWRSP